jgi:hypothetical protein
MSLGTTGQPLYRCECYVEAGNLILTNKCTRKVTYKMYFVNVTVHLLVNIRFLIFLQRIYNIKFPVVVKICDESKFSGKLAWGVA